MTINNMTTEQLEKKLDIVSRDWSLTLRAPAPRNNKARKLAMLTSLKSEIDVITEELMAREVVA